MIQYINKLDFEYKYLDEIELLEDIVLEESYIKELENIKMEFEVPNNKLIIFYKDSTFMYYTEFGDIIYKYLNVACRKYVIDNNCLIKQFNHLKSITYLCKTRAYVTRVFLMLLSNG